MSRPADRDERAPALGVLDAALEALLAAQLGDDRQCRRALRELAGLARRWSGAPDLSKFAPAMERDAPSAGDDEPADASDLGGAP